MITLDNDGFTLSPLVELGCNSWKGRKDRATVLKTVCLLLLLAGYL